MDVAALILLILAALAFVPWPNHPVERWGLVLLTVGFICQWTTVSDQLVNL